MKTLINKIDFDIRIFENNGTSIPISENAELTEIQYQEITDKFYNIGTDEEPVMYDLKLVNGITFESVVEEIHDQVLTISYKDRDEAIIGYNKKNIDNSFFKKKYKIEINNFKKFNTSPYRTFTTLADNDPDIIKGKRIKNETTSYIEGSIYLDRIDGDESEIPLQGTDYDMILNAVYADTGGKVFILTVNDAYNLL